MAAGSANVRLFERVASQRFDDAEALFDAGPGHETGAVYLAGYAVECSLKALILSVVPTSREHEVLGSFRGSRGHNFDSLRHQFAVETGGGQFPASLSQDFSRVNTWDTDWRYNPGTTRPTEARAFLDSAAAVIRWINGRI